MKIFYIDKHLIEKKIITLPMLKNLIQLYVQRKSRLTGKATYVSYVFNIFNVTKWIRAVIKIYLYVKRFAWVKALKLHQIKI